MKKLISIKNIVVAFGHAPSCMLPFLIKKQKNVRLIGSQHNPITYSKLYSLYFGKLFLQ